MDKVISTRVDEEIAQTLDALALTLRTSKNASSRTLSGSIARRSRRGRTRSINRSARGGGRKHRMSCTTGYAPPSKTPCIGTNGEGLRRRGCPDLASPGNGNRKRVHRRSPCQPGVRTLGWRHAAGRDYLLHANGEEAATLALFSQFKTAPVEQATVDAAGEIYRRWNPSHGTGVNDAILAATVRATGGKLYCLNTRHYPMEDIVVEQAWTPDPHPGARDVRDMDARRPRSARFTFAKGQRTLQRRNRHGRCTRI